MVKAYKLIILQNFQDFSNLKLMQSRTKITAMYSDGLQTCGFCLVVDFHQGGFATNIGTLSSSINYPPFRQVAAKDLV